MNRITGTICAIVLGLFIATSVNAAPIVTWNLSGEPGNQASSPATNAANNVTGMALTRGVGLSANAGANSLNSAGWTNEETDFITFGFSVAAGFQVDLDNLTFTSRSSNTGPGSLQVFTSLDGFATAVGSITQVGTSDTNNDFDLSGLGPISGDFTIRILQNGTTSANGGTTAAGGTFRISNSLEFTGTVSQVPLTNPPSATAIPLPGSVAIWLISAGCAAAFGLRRRNRTVPS